jgi:hypothetical protein
MGIKVVVEVADEGAVHKYMFTHCPDYKSLGHTPIGGENPSEDNIPLEEGWFDEGGAPPNVPRAPAGPPVPPQGAQPQQPFLPPSQPREPVRPLESIDELFNRNMRERGFNPDGTPLIPLPE